MKDTVSFVAIDAHAIIHRAYHAYPSSLRTTTGIQDNAVYGFTVMLLRILEIYDPKYVVCAFDTAAPTFRHAQFTEYKAQRKAPDDELVAQFSLVEEIVKAFNIPILKQEGYEADDILGTIAQNVDSGKWNSQDIKLAIVTGDRDLLQLITPRVSVCLPQGSFRNIEVFDREAMFKKYGYYPEQVVDYKGIVGDSSDNIPGIKGVGEKTALELLKQYSTLEGIYSNLNKVKNRYRKLFEEGAEQAAFSRDLATIKKDIPLYTNLEDCLMKDFRRQDVIDVFKKFEFRSLMNKIPKSVDDELEDKQEPGLQMNLFGEPNDYLKRNSDEESLSKDSESDYSGIKEDVFFEKVNDLFKGRNVDEGRNKNVRNSDKGKSRIRLAICFLNDRESKNRVGECFVRLTYQNNEKREELFDSVIHSQQGLMDKLLCFTGSDECETIW